MIDVQELADLTARAMGYLEGFAEVCEAQQQAGDNLAVCTAALMFAVGMAKFEGFAEEDVVAMLRQLWRTIPAMPPKENAAS